MDSHLFLRVCLKQIWWFGAHLCAPLKHQKTQHKHLVQRLIESSGRCLSENNFCRSFHFFTFGWICWETDRFSTVSLLALRNKNMLSMADSLLPTFKFISIEEGWQARPQQAHTAWSARHCRKKSRYQSLCDDVISWATSSSWAMEICSDPLFFIPLFASVRL